MASAARSAVLRWPCLGGVSILAMLLGCPLLGGGSSPPPPPATIYGKAPRSEFTGQAPSIDLLVRGFLVRGREAQQGFACYAYLIFLDAGADGRGDREAAAAAFVEMLEDVDEVQTLRGFSPARAAILYAPVKKPPAEQTVASILSVYDYAAANLIARRIEQSGGRVPQVALVAAPSAIDAAAPAAGLDVRVHDLTGDPAAARARLRRFHQELVHPSGAVTTSQVLDKVRSFLDSVGSLLVILKDPTLGTATPPP